MTNLLERLRELVAPQSAGQAQDSHQLAMAVLLVEVARADHVDDPAEKATLLALLSELCGLSDAEASALLAEAEQTADQDVSLHRHLDVLNRSLAPEDKARIMRAMWEMAYADGELHAYEEHLLRRLADLLHVRHADFVRSKHAVAEVSDSK